MKNRANKFAALLVLVLMLATLLAMPASAASYSKVYGQTQDRIRVRASASTSGAVIDNIVKNACVYVTDSKTSGSITFIKVNYIGSDGKKLSGWLCQKDNSQTYVKILSKSQADDKFGVSGGDLPSKRVGTFTASQRGSAAESSSGSGSDDGYIKFGSQGEGVSQMQTKLKEMGFYSGEITGNVGNKTVAAIKGFQEKYGLTADGVAGPQTLAKIDAAYASRGNSGSSDSGSSGGGLKQGSKGSEVSELQRNLTTLGYYWADITGNFGEKTKTAVKRFQEENGLSADGVAGAKTIAAIAKAMAGKTSSGSSTAVSSGTVLKLNSQGTTVSQMQTDLKQLGYYYAEITGNFGEKTEAAVKKFQERNGLSADGVAGPKTLEAIRKAVAAAGGSVSSSGSVSGGVSGLKLGSTGEKVYALQRDLTTLGYYYGDITGHFGTMTQTAVKKFQKSRGLTQDGVAGTDTLNAISSAVRGSTGSDSALGSTGVSVAGTLREGDSGDAVRDMQLRLQKLGYYYGEVTGHFGTLTRKAVRAFQDDNDLTVDGVAGSATLKLLSSLTGGGSIITNPSVGGGTVVDEADSYAVISKDNVYLRKSYSTSSAAIASMGVDTRVRVTRKYTVSGETWYYISVTLDGVSHKGYVRADMVSFTNDWDDSWGVDTGEAEILGMIRVTATSVNVRDDWGTDAKVVGTASIGDVFYYIDTVEGWFQTKAGYWISRDYVKVMSDDEVNDYTNNGGTISNTYREGDTGTMVKWIQETLADLGYYDGEITGNFGSLTKEAVRLFQRDHDLGSDGVAGPKTIAKLNEVATGEVSGSVDQGYNPKIYNLNWFDYQRAVYMVMMPKGSTFTLTDIARGVSFNVKVQSVSGNHADVEPATSADTDVLCSLYNVSSANMLVTQNKYQRRAMVATAHTKSGDVQFICSIYAIPHGNDTVSNNDFNGQFCVHFNGSKTHGSDRVDNDANGHQDMISKGASTLAGKGYQISTVWP